MFSKNIITEILGVVDRNLKINNEIVLRYNTQVTKKY